MPTALTTALLEDPETDDRQFDPKQFLSAAHVLGAPLKAPAGANTINRRERDRITAEFHKHPELGGTVKLLKKERALAIINSCLNNCGFELDLVSGDMLIGDANQRLLSFSRQRPAGSDPYTPGTTIENSRVVFVWENLAQSWSTRKSFEVIVYLS